jgi:hypothetical protein
LKSNVKSSGAADRAAPHGEAADGIVVIMDDDCEGAYKKYHELSSIDQSATI